MVSVWLVVPWLAAFAGPPDSSAQAAGARVDALAQRALAATVVDAPPVDDAVFLRRVWLDLAGRTPPAPVVKEFLADRSPGKRAAMIERLVESEDFAEAWGRGLAEEFLDARAAAADEYDGRAFAVAWRDGLAARKSLAALARETIAAQGVSDANPLVNFLLRWQGKPKESASATARAFLGVSLACAECHDHPFAPWKQRDFQAFGAFFENVRYFESYDEEEGSYLTALLDRAPRPYAIRDPNDAEAEPTVVAPRLLGAAADAPADARRAALADWITADDNPYFRRNAANVVWKRMFGKPLVASLDSPLDPKAPATVLLDGLAGELAASGDRVDRLVRAIAASRLYQVDATRLSGSLGPLRESLEPLAFRPLSVDQLFWSLEQATGVDAVEQLVGDEGTLESLEAEDAPGQTFGLDPQAVQRWLALQNDEFVRAALESGATAAKAACGRKVGPEHVRWLFYATLAREPSPAELKSMTALAAEEKGPRGLEDVLWVLLNSVEFNCNH